MKPCSRRVLPTSNLLQNVGFGSKNTVASIKGSIKKLGIQYENALVVLYSKTNFNPIAMRRPDANGAYEVNGLNNTVDCFITAFDLSKQYNAVIQDGVVPK